MSLKLKINFLILIITTILVGSLSIFTWSTNQLEDINTKRKFGQILLSTSDQLTLGKLLLESDSMEKAKVSSDLIDDIFIMQIAIKNNSQNETQAEQLANLRNIQVQLPAANLLLEALQAHFKNNEELRKEDILNLGQLDIISSEIQETVGIYNRYLNTEEIRIIKTTALYTNIIIGLMVILVLSIITLSTFGILRPINTLTQFAETISQGTYDQSIEFRSRDEFGHLGDTFNAMSAQLSDLITNLEKRITERTLELEKHSAYLEGSADVSQAVASITDAEELIWQAVDIIKERFDIYYVGLFLSDAKNEWAILQAGTGEAGKTMLEQKHRLQIGKGMIGWSIAHAEARIALDVGEDAIRFENPALPETRSEGALPLRSRGRVLGALTVQSSQPAAFNQNIINTLQTMADHIAVSLDNADLFAKSEAALEAERKAYSELSQDDWHTLLQRENIPTYTSDAPNSVRSLENEVQESEETLQNEGLTTTIPIKIRGHILGGLKLRKEKEQGAWTEEELGLAKTLAEQASISLENARLFDQSQRQAARERIIGEASSRMRETLNIEGVLKVAASELRKSLGVEKADVWVSAEHLEKASSEPKIGDESNQSAEEQDE